MRHSFDTLMVRSTDSAVCTRSQLLSVNKFDQRKILLCFTQPDQVNFYAFISCTRLWENSCQKCQSFCHVFHHKTLFSMISIRAASQPINLQLLLFQYDPILQKSLVDTAGLIQSIIYELIYEKVIHSDIFNTTTQTIMD